MQYFHVRRRAAVLTGLVACSLLSPSTATSRWQVGTDDVDLETRPGGSSLIDKVKRKLAGGHRVLGSVTASLLSVQADVASTEKSMLGRVLDVQSAQSIFGRHEKIQTANKLLKSEISKLNNQSAGLSSKLHMLRQTRADKAQKYRLSEKKLRAQVAEDMVVIRNLEAEMEKQQYVVGALKRLKCIHRQLVASIQNGTLTEQKLRRMLCKSRSARRAEAQRQSEMKTHLKKIQKYNWGCHNAVQKAASLADTALVADADDGSVATLTLHQQHEANSALEQRLSDEHAMLASQVKGAEAKEVQEIQQLRDLRSALQQFENATSFEAHQMQHHISLESDRLRSFNMSLLENQQHEAEDLAMKQAQDQRIATLTKQMHHASNSISKKALQERNNALRMELDSEAAKLREAKQQEEAAVLAVEQAEAEVAKARRELEIANAAVVAAGVDSQRVVRQSKPRLSKDRAFLAVKQTEESVPTEEKVPVIPEQCSGTWDVIWTKKRAELKACKNLEAQLTFEDGLRDTMLKTLQTLTES